MLSISLYYISISWQNLRGIVRDIIFIRAVTHSISETSISSRGRANVNKYMTKRRRVKKKGGRKKEKKTDILEKAKHPTCQLIHVYISLSLRRKVSISPRDFGIWSRIFIKRNCHYDGKYRETTERSLIRERPIWKRGQDLGARKPGPTEFIASPPWNLRTIEPWIQPADRRQNAGASSRSPAMGRRLINGDKRDENRFDLSDERERD